MNKLNHPLPATLLAAVVVGLALFWVWPRQPLYQGRTLNQWLEEYHRFSTNSTDGVQRQRFEERIAALGPSILPDLVSVLKGRAGLNFENNQAHFLFQSAATRRLGRWLDNRVFEAQHRRLEASYLLGVMGPQAEPAIPVMIRIYQNTNETSWLRQSILDSLGRINRRPELVGPVLDESLYNQSGSTAVEAALALGEIGTNSISAISTLRQRLNHENRLVAVEAARAIHEIDPTASLAAVDEIMPLLLKELEFGDYYTWRITIPLLAQYGDRAKAAVPFLVKIRKVGDVHLRWQAVEALKKIDPEAAAEAGMK